MTLRFQRQTGLLLGILALLLAAAGCGYHTEGHAVRLPSDLRTMYVPTFVNMTHSYRVEQVLTEAVVRDLRSRTNYHIVTDKDAASTADATLAGTVTNTIFVPLTYDSVTGNISSSLVIVTMRVSLTDQKGTVLYQNQNYSFREQYQVSTNSASFFDEKNPAVQRVANDFAGELVSNLLEAY